MLIEEKMITSTKKRGSLPAEDLLKRFSALRKFSEELCAALEPEDCVVQSMPDASPAKWHLAHTSWFFERFILYEAYKNYKPFHKDFFFLYNSYYIQAGDRFTRADRGLITRPGINEIINYRNYVTGSVINFLTTEDEELVSEFLSFIEIGIHHEQQHQELILTDIKHLFSKNPLYPVYYESKKDESPDKKAAPLSWKEFDEGIYLTGNNGEGFSYDNERMQHKQYLNKFAIANRLITNGEFLEFIEDDGYKRAELWLSDGFAKVEAERWNAPLYWEKIDNRWNLFTLTGLKKLNLMEPVSHVSYYEADAFARWKGFRLPSEAEWESASNTVEVKGNFVETKNFHPAELRADDSNNLNQMFGDVWEWTQSAYLPYPGFKILPGAVGEYNGKFMSGQMVLRGGSCASSASHLRRTYRNFFPPEARWQFSGIRLAKDV
jgi:ergothioneine biosynthesis protein EgtB